MYKFYCKPNLDKLNADYITDRAQEFYEGFDYYNQSEGYYISEEFDEITGHQFEEDFKELLKEFELEEHYDELLYLIIDKNEEHCLKFQNAVMIYHDNKKVKEMADLILFLNKLNSSDGLKIVLSSPVDKTTVTNNQLAEMVINVLNGEINNWNSRQPLMKYGELFVQSFVPDLTMPSSLNRDDERLKKISSRRNPHYKRLESKFKVELCLFIYPYLQNQTTLRATESRYSNQQYRFWFKLLTSLKLQGEINSPETDYMSAMISNHSPV